MNPRKLTDDQLGIEIVKLSRSRVSGRRNAAKVTALRTEILRRQREADRQTRSEREQRMQERREKAAAERREREAAELAAYGGDFVSPEVERSWLEVDLLANLALWRRWNLFALTPERERELEREYDRIMAAEDPLAEAAAVKAQCLELARSKAGPERCRRP